MQMHECKTSNKVLPFAVSRLAIKFLLVMIPVFVLLTSVGLSHFAAKKTGDTKDALHARLGSQIAMMAASVEQAIERGDTRSPQQLLNMLLTDRAIDCAEITKNSSKHIVLMAPQSLGCTGAKSAHQLKISIGENNGHVLKILYNENEVKSVARAQQEISVLAILAGIGVAIIASTFSFGMIIGQPLQTLLKTINTFSSTGEITVVKRLPKDELGKVICAFNSMQGKLSRKTAAMEKLIDQQQKTEENLRISNDRLKLAQEFLQEQLEQIDDQRQDQKTILDNMPHSVIWVDESRNIRMLSKRVSEVLWISKKQFQHVKSLRDLITILAKRQDFGSYKDDAELSKIINDQVEILCSEQDINKVLRINMHSIGQHLHVQVAQLPDGGCIIGQHDITDQVIAENKLYEARKGLHEANAVLEKRVDARTRDLVKAQNALLSTEREATYGKLVSKFCHEIRNPLNALNVSLFVIKSQVETNAKLQKTFDRSERTIQRCSEILNDFHDFALARELKLEPVEMCDWLKKECALYPTPQNISIETDILKTSVYCNIDAKVFANALKKLLQNSIQALQDNNCSKTGKAINVTMETSNNTVKLVVSDNGIGMDNKTSGEALQPLFSTRGFGVGLGLPIAQQSLHYHGGLLQLKSTPGKGTTITMTLPKASQLKKVG